MLHSVLSMRLGIQWWKDGSGCKSGYNASLWSPLLSSSALAWAFQGSVPLGIWALPWNSSCLPDLGILFLFLSGYLHISLFPHCLHVPSCSFKSFHSFFRLFLQQQVQWWDCLWPVMGRELSGNDCVQCRAIPDLLPQRPPLQLLPLKPCHTSTEGFIHIAFLNRKSPCHSLRTE